MIMKATIYSLEGKVLKQMDLPAQFSVEGRADLIKRAVLSEESRLYQPKGAYKYAGLETSARYRGRKEDFGAIKNRGISRLPREVLPEGQFGKVKRIPFAVKGRRAHPPKPEKKIVELLNRKEYRKALLAAIALTTDRDTVSSRYKADIGLSLPIVLDNSFEKLNKTKDVLKVFKALKLDKFLERAKQFNTKSPLVVVSGGSILKAARNLPGVDVVSVEDLKVRHLAPGTHPGRLTLYSEGAITKISEIGGAL
jgi:large subunit ribosomal protein L4e